MIRPGVEANGGCDAVERWPNRTAEYAHRHRHRVYTRILDAGHLCPLELGVEERNIEADIVSQERVRADEGDHFPGNLIETRRGDNIRVGQPGQLADVLRDSALGVDQGRI